ncbi:MAG: hypothetical protein SWN98_13220 [Pseudomonadota bacterium]|nr:hypothetical protein [Pseudomonadota bacterium]
MLESDVMKRRDRQTALIAVPLYTVTASDRARALEVCRSTYAVAA